MFAGVGGAYKKPKLADKTAAAQGTAELSVLCASRVSYSPGPQVIIMHEVVTVRVNPRQSDLATVTAISATQPFKYQILSYDGCYDDSETGKWRNHGKKVGEIQKRG